MLQIRSAHLCVGLLYILSISSARADILYSQLDHGVGVGFGVVSNDQRHPLDQDYDAQAADDFLIPANTIWSLSEILVLGQHHDEITPITRAHVFIYSDAVGMPGSLVYSTLDATVAATSSSDFGVPVSVELAAGTYWLSVQSAWPEYQDWIWSRREPATGYNGLWRNPLDGFEYGHTEWTEIPDLSFLANSPASSDLLFEIRGNLASVPEPSGFAMLVGTVVMFHFRRRVHNDIG